MNLKDLVKAVEEKTGETVVYVTGHIKPKPQRIQRRRSKGWKKPEGCINVTRPGKFGNPFRLTPDGWIMCYSINRKILDPWILWSVTGGFTINDIIELYEIWIKGNLKRFGYLPTPPDIKELKGHDLMCWCKEGDVCHADILLKLANND